jgi:hypothetical protein
MSLPTDDEKDKIVVENDYPEFPNVSSNPEAGGSPRSDSSPGLENQYHLDEIIPPTHTHRTIVLCFNGTGDQFDEDVRTPPFFDYRKSTLNQNLKNSNIIQFFSMLRKG